MEKFEFFQKIYDKKRHEGQSLTFLILMRSMMAMMAIYYGLMAILCFTHDGIPHGFVYTAVAVACLILIHASAYVSPNKVFAVFANLITYACVFAMLTLSLHAGFQNPVYALLLLIFISPYISLRRKGFFAGFISFVLLVILILSELAPDLLNFRAMPLDAASVFLLINEAALIVMVCVIGAVFAQTVAQSESKLLAYSEQMRQDATTDSLTRLPNRRGIYAVLDTLIKNHDKYGEQFSIAIGDIDLFKNVNDTYGHEAGDYILQEVAAILQQQIAGHGSVCRWGGEEFLMTFRNRNGDEAFLLTDSIRLILQNHKFIYKGEMISIQMTFGIDEYDKNAGLEQTIQNADEKLYLGKRSGRNRCVF